MVKLKIELNLKLSPTLINNETFGLVFFIPSKGGTFLDLSTSINSTGTNGAAAVVAVETEKEQYLTNTVLSLPLKYENRW